MNPSNSALSQFSPDFVYNDNDSEHPKQVFSTLKENLMNCEEFAFSVAFITKSGLSLLKMALREAKKRHPNLKGRIITSNYLDFTDPDALKEFRLFDNIEVRMYYIQPDDAIGFHTKGYLFRLDENHYKAIIGSSNLTDKALTTNNEWNNLIVSTKEGKVMQSILSEFERMWKLSLPLDSVLEQYQEEYRVKREERIKERRSNLPLEAIRPNSMQQVFIQRLNESISRGDRRGLLISATGTGKTYAAAFGIRSITQFHVRKLLFVTHRETILKQAMNTFRKVLTDKRHFALFTGNNHDIQGADYIFSTISTIADERYLNIFSKDEFDVIIIDECHRIGEKTRYKKLLDYFAPKYLLGMSATPDRSDGFDVYNVFEHNILYEIRLNDALKSNMLVPFHYFGISDLSLNGRAIDDQSEFRFLTCDERVRHILENSKYYGYSGSRLKCLLFVSRVEEGKELARKISERGVKARFIDGSIASTEREKTMRLLEEDDIRKEHLDMIVTVDVFNEGVDIPSVNQLIFLRPTQSSIIFLQQLGRGLRLHDGKEFLTVIDFIGNYKSNFIIPMTLGKKSSGFLGPRQIHPQLVGGSVVQFDQKTEEEIIRALTWAKVTDFERVKEQYINCKNRLGRIPTIIEFDKEGKISGRSFMDNGMKSCPSYYSFLVRMKEENDCLSPEKKDTLVSLSQIIGAGQRLLEPLLLKHLIKNRTEDDFKKSLDKIDLFYNSNHKEPILHEMDDSAKECILSVLNFSFDRKKDMNPIPCVELDENGKFQLTSAFSVALTDSVFFRHVSLILDYAIYSNQRYFKNIYDDKFQFVLYEKYTRKQVCQLINLTKNQESTLYGYRVFDKNLVVPIFVTYHKHLEEDASTNYKDEFINPSVFCWDSRSNRTLESGEIQKLIEILHHPKGRVLLFILRNDVVDKDGLAVKNQDRSFLFMGQLKYLQNPQEATNGNETKTSVVKFRFLMKDSVDNDIYQYLLSNPVVE